MTALENCQSPPKYIGIQIAEIAIFTILYLLYFYMSILSQQVNLNKYTMGTLVAIAFLMILNLVSLIIIMSLELSLLPSYDKSQYSEK